MNIPIATPLKIDPDGLNRKVCNNCKSFCSCGQGKGFACLAHTTMVKPTGTCKDFVSRHTKGEIKL